MIPQKVWETGKRRKLEKKQKKNKQKGRSIHKKQK